MFDNMFTTDTAGGAPRKRVGVNIATVCDIKDPKKLGRVKCRFVTGDKEVEDTEWAYVTTPFGGNKSGIFFHPNVGDAVLLAFEDGDIHSPFVIGSVWWTNKDIKREAPVKVADDNEKNEIYKISTPQNHTITMLDKNGEEKIEIKTKAGNLLLINDGGKKIELRGENGETGFFMDLQQGSISVKCKKFSVEAGSNKFTIDSSGAVLDCKPSVSIKSAEIKAEASGTGTVKGGILNLESAGIANLKGQIVKIN